LGGVSGVAYSPDGKTVLMGSYSGTASLWDVRTGNVLFTLQNQPESVNLVAYGPDGETVLTGSVDGIARLWNPHNGQLLFTLRDLTKEITSMDYGPDGSTVLIGGYDGTVRLWNAHTGEKLEMLCPNVLDNRWLVGGWVLVAGMIGIVVVMVGQALSR
jgi:WD40 repeat protein